MHVKISRVNAKKIEVENVVFKMVEGKNGNDRCVVGKRWHCSLVMSQYIQNKPDLGVGRTANGIRKRKMGQIENIE